MDYEKKYKEALEKEATSWAGSSAIDAFEAGAEWQKGQKSVEWSEEDRLHYANVLEALEYVKGCKSDYDKIEAVKSDIAWLKSLRPSWKPSEKDNVPIRTATLDLIEAVEKYIRQDISRSTLIWKKEHLKRIINND